MLSRGTVLVGDMYRCGHSPLLPVAAIQPGNRRWAHLTPGTLSPCAVGYAASAPWEAKPSNVMMRSPSQRGAESLSGSTAGRPFQR